MHPYGELQEAARETMSKCPGFESSFAPAHAHPELIPIAEVRKEATPEQFTAELTAFALAHEADDIGITSMDPLYVFQARSFGRDKRPRFGRHG